MFAKCEALEVKAIIALEQKGVSFNDAVAQAPKHAEKMLETVHQKLKEKKFPPNGHVYLQGEQIPC
jgi:hypothetical protein